MVKGKWELEHPDYYKRYRERNIERIKELNKLYYQKNKERIKKRVAEWIKNNPTKVKDIRKKFYKNHPTYKGKLQRKYRKAFPEKQKKLLRKFRSTGKGKAASKRANVKRRARKKIGATLTKQEWRDILVDFNYQCAYCGKSNIPLTQDHVLPLSRGGHHTKENVVPVCLKCNLKKGTKTLEEFLRGKRR